MALYKDERPQSIADWVKDLREILYEETRYYLGFCTDLETFLEAKRWREADLETTKVLTQIAKSKGVDQARLKEAFHCTALQVLDDLWIGYSNGQFGFSVQDEIWQEISKQTNIGSRNHFREFCGRVGWASGWFQYSDLEFTINAPKGHLPSLMEKTQNDPAFWQSWKGKLEHLLPKLEICLGTKNK